MIWKITTIAAIAALAAGCASQPRPENSINIIVGPDGKMTAVSSSKDPDDRAMAALLSGALNGGSGSEQNQKELTDDQIWSRDGDGNVTHIQSGATCPAQWAGFTRNRLEVFIRDGMNVGCNYGLGTTSALTFYVYEGTTLEDELESALDAMKTRQPLSRETPYHAPSVNGSYQARTLAYETASGTAMRTSVLIGKAGDWFLKMRLTCPAAEAARLEQTVGIALIGQSDRLGGAAPAATKGTTPPPI
jgi:hypothetical protein